MPRFSSDSRILRGDTIPRSDITPPEAVRGRRRWLQRMGMASAGLLLAPAGSLLTSGTSWAADAPTPTGAKLPATVNPRYRLGPPTDPLTTFENVTHYNNFYEFGTDKSDPAEHAHTLVTHPWAVKVEGEVHAPQTFSLDQMMKLAPMEDRVYRHRCVEGWSMVIPWVGFPLAALVQKVQPTGNAKFVQFVTQDDPAHMPGLSEPILNWPYTEGLRLDEAMNPLTLLTFGLYGQVLPNQNGAPVRIVVPWKYGFKSAKSIVAIRFVAQQPATAWNQQNATEYGFYSNVNPHVDHPRWSQATERRIGDGFFTPKRPTLMFNGYGDQVASMYAGMDLKTFF